MWAFKAKHCNHIVIIKVDVFQSEANYSSKFQPQKNHFSVDRPVSIHIVTNIHNKACKTGL